MTTRLACSILALVIATGARALADPTAFAPEPVVHAVYLQTQGTFASMSYLVEPCTTAGMADAVAKADADVENRDPMSLGVEQGRYAVGFARCALDATTADRFATLAAATIQCGMWAIVAHKSEGSLAPSDKAKAEQYDTIAKWLNASPVSSATDKEIAQKVIAALKGMGLV